MPKRMRMELPFLPIKWHNGNRLTVMKRETIEINTHAVWVRARVIKRLYAARRAKKMSCHARVERVLGEQIMAMLQKKI